MKGLRPLTSTAISASIHIPNAIFVTGWFFHSGTQQVLKCWKVLFLATVYISITHQIILDVTSINSNSIMVY